MIKKIRGAFYSLSIFFISFFIFSTSYAAIQQKPKLKDPVKIEIKLLYDESAKDRRKVTLAKVNQPFYVTEEELITLDQICNVASKKVSKSADSKDKTKDSTCLELTFTNEGLNRLTNTTYANYGKRLGVFVDDKLIITMKIIAPILEKKMDIVDALAYQEISNIITKFKKTKDLRRREKYKDVDQYGFCRALITDIKDNIKMLKPGFPELVSFDDGNLLIEDIGLMKRYNIDYSYKVEYTKTEGTEEVTYTKAQEGGCVILVELTPQGLTDHFLDMRVPGDGKTRRRFTRIIQGPNNKAIEERVLIDSQNIKLAEAIEAVIKEIGLDR